MKATLIALFLPLLGCGASATTQSATAKPAKSLPDIFAYYDKFAANFKAKDIGAITQHWAPDYKDWFGGTGPSGKEMLHRQMDYKGQFGNSAGNYCLSLVRKGDLVEARGLRMASFRMVLPDGSLSEGGASGDKWFIDTWKLQGDVWLLTKTVADEKRRPYALQLNYGDVQQLKKEHEALGKKLTEAGDQPK